MKIRTGLQSFGRKAAVNSKPESASDSALSGLKIVWLEVLPAMVMMMVVVMMVAFRVS